MRRPQRVNDTLSLVPPANEICEVYVAFVVMLQCCHCMLGYTQPPTPRTRGRHPSRAGPSRADPPGSRHPPPELTSPHRSRHPPGVDPLRADTSPPGSRHPLRADTPSAVHAGRYGQQAGSTHPTGMYTC